MISIAQLAKCTGATVDVAAVWLDPLDVAMTRYNIVSPLRIVSFLAQIGVESSGLTHTRENMNYTPQALIATFNTPRYTRFSQTDANSLGRNTAHSANQQAIANIAYADRMGNGDRNTGDGWRYRGGGPGQLTGKSNYDECGQAIGVDLLTQPELIEQPGTGALSFAWFWDNEKLNDIADTGNFDEVSDFINIGHHTAAIGDAKGYSARLALYNIGLIELGVQNV
jgi:putative chitinase